MNDHSSPADREQAIQDWEKATAHKSLVPTRRKSILAGLGLVTLTLGGLALAWNLKNPQEKSAAKESRPGEIEIAERKPVPKLPNEPVAEPPSPPVAQTPAIIMDQHTDQAQAQREEQARRLQEARMKSSLLAQSAQSAQSQTAAVPLPLTGSLGTTAPQGPQDSNSKFARAVSGQGVPVSQARQIHNLEFKILQGKLIEAVLEPRAISDLPGMVCATVQRDVHAQQGRIKLIPWGSKVCGVYSGDLRKGQERLFIVWNTLRRPDGVEVTLDSVGSDQMGSVGMGGQVNTHFAEIFGTSALLSIVGAGASTAGVESGDQYNSEAYYRQSVQQAAAQTAQQLLQPYVNIPPTVTVPAGSKVRIYVNRDLDFSSLYEEETRKSDGPQLIF